MCCTPFTRWAQIVAKVSVLQYQDSKCVLGQEKPLTRVLWVFFVGSLFYEFSNLQKTETTTKVLR
jgi:hypothetical protein